MNRPWTYTLAAILQFVLSLLAIGVALSTLPQGAAALNSVEGPGYAFIVMALITGVAGLFAAFGVWKNQKWGVILTIVLRALDGLLALPGLIFAQPLPGKLMALSGVVLAIVVIALLLWPRPKAGPVSHDA